MHTVLLYLASKLCSANMASVECHQWKFTTRELISDAKDASYLLQGDLQQ